MSTVFYGPHCRHDECGWSACDHTGLVEFPCHHQETCPHCGPNSAQWPRVARGTTEWLTSLYRTVDVEQLRAIEGIPGSAVRYAELLKAHGVTEPA